MLAPMPTRGLSRFLAVCVAILLSGCGLFEDDDRAPWRAQAEAACFARGSVKLTTLIREGDEVDGKGACGLDRPLKVLALADGSVRLGERALTMSCPVTAALETWVRTVVVPAAYQSYGMPVVELKSMGTYNCRTRNNRRGARLSEHAFANAIDISGFVLADGRTVSVKKDWRGTEADRSFLRTAHAGACGPFTTVLGPGSDGLHEDHIHMDLARHDAAGTRRYCKPLIRMPMPDQTPTIWAANPGATVIAAVPPGAAPAWPRVLPQSVEAATATPVPATDDDPNADIGLTIDDLIGASPAAYPASQPASCPPGYVCTPADPALALPPPVGWDVGPQPLQPATIGPLGYDGH
jgi:hypothetical protein